MNLEPATEAKVAETVETCRKHGCRNIIVLWGAPRTGKSFVALIAAQRFAGHELLVRTVQFHQSYGYEDFVEGFRPTPSGGFVPVDGVFVDWNKRALADPKNQYVLLIEELSRANISNVIGELLTYIEYRDRTFVTPITRSQLTVARNLTILATMNPRDRSALELDDAVISRLRIISCPPSVDQLEEMLKSSLKNGGKTKKEQSIIAALKGLFDRCKAEHQDTYEEGMPFGHGIFAGIRDEDDLAALWQQQIAPLLRRPNVPAHPFYATIESNYPWARKANGEAAASAAKPPA